MRVIIDGKEIEARSDATIIQAAEENGIKIPSLCYLRHAKPSDTPCLLCMVDVEGRGRLRACATKVEEGWKITTKSKELDAFRQKRLQSLADIHYGDCRAPCNLTCPGGINVQGYINLIARGEYLAALRLIKEKNPLPASVGRVCPRFCETRCRRVLIEEPIAINDLKRFVADWAMENGYSECVAAPSTGKKIAIIGGGPAGLSCAYYLRHYGHDVSIFEAQQKLGGALRYYMPSYKLPKKIIEKEIACILDMNVHFKTGRTWGIDFTIQDLLDQGYHSVFIATGLNRQKVLDIQGSELALDALNILRDINANKKIKKADKALVVGGGGIAVDTARSLRRIGVKNVTIIYPRSRVELSAQQREIIEAEKEGIQFFLMAMPLRVIKDNGKIKVEMARTILSEPDERGIRNPVPMPGSRLFWEGDMVINAQGQEGDEIIKTFGEIEAKLELTPKFLIKSNPTTMATNIKGIYAGGDVTTGPRSVIQAIASGRRAAEAIHEFVMQESLDKAESRFGFTKGRKFEEVDLHNFEGYSMQLREIMPARPPERRIFDFNEVEIGLTEEMATREAKRCLQCGCVGLSKCSFKEIAEDFKVNYTNAPLRMKYKIDTSHPFMIVDLNKCIGCGRCARSCKYDALDLNIILNPETMVLDNVSLNFNDKCVSCGKCVDSCPTGAIVKKELVVPLFPNQMESVSSVCAYCGTGCSIDIVTKNGVIMEVKARDDMPPNFGDLCVKGRFGYTFYRHSERLTRPLIRESIDEPFRETTWVDALNFAAQKFLSYKKNHGSNSIGVLASSRCTNEDNYLLQKLARAVIGTNSVDNCARVCHAPSVSGLLATLGSGAATTPFSQIVGTDCLLICGSNTTEAHPIVGLKVKEAVNKGAKIIVIDPRRTEVAKLAEESPSGIFLRTKPGANIPLLNGILNVIFEEGLENKEFIENRVEGFEAIKKHVASYDLNKVSEITGVPPEKIRDAARLYATSEKSLILYGLGVAEHKGGTYGVMALANLVLATGHVGRPHCGINPLRGQNNVQGSCDMGALPYTYPGYQHLDDVNAMEVFCKVWEKEALPVDEGLMEPQMYEKALKGELKALYIVGYDPAHTQSNIAAVQKSLKALEFLVVQDMFMTETAKLANVVFPSSCAFEKDGTVTSGERRVRRLKKAVDPPGYARPDWEIICDLAKAMGYPMNYRHPSEIMDEIAKVSPGYRGISYDRIGEFGQVWPCPDSNHPGTPLLHAERFPIGKGRFVPVNFIMPEEDADSEYPFVLITGRRLEHYNNGSMTRRCENFDLLMPHELISIHPDDAKRLNIADGQLVDVQSRRGRIKVHAKITLDVMPGNVFMTFHFDDALANLLTSQGMDVKTMTPEYKVCAVKILPAK